MTRGGRSLTNIRKSGARRPYADILLGCRLDREIGRPVCRRRTPGRTVQVICILPREIRAGRCTYHKPQPWIASKPAAQGAVSPHHPRFHQWTLRFPERPDTLSVCTASVSRVFSRIAAALTAAISPAVMKRGCIYPLADRKGLQHWQPWPSTFQNSNSIAPSYAG